MKIKNISFSQSQETMSQTTGLKKWNKVGMEAELEDGDDPQMSMLELKKKVEIIFKVNNPQLVDGGTVDWKPNYDFTTTPIPTVDYRAKEKLEIDIDNATTKADLEFYVEAAEKYGLMELWNEKNNSLK